MSDMDPKKLSDEYYRFVSDFTQSKFMDEKILGKFYTDHGVAENMMLSLCNQISADFPSDCMRIIEPFCGDGRLVVQFLKRVIERPRFSKKHFFITIWDIDRDALSEAKKNIEAFCTQHDLKFDIEAQPVDAFVEHASHCGSFDVCVTNPPWGLLKPQKTFVKLNDEIAMGAYRSAIEQYNGFMKTAFKLSQPTSQYGKWGTNLGRCGIEVALKLIGRDGVCGIVSPASLMNDQVSAPLRTWLFEQFGVVNISYFPAELKLYGSADVSSVSLVVNAGVKTEGVQVQIFSGRESCALRTIDIDSYRYIQAHAFAIPLKTGIDSISIMAHLEQFPTAMEYCDACGLRFAREMDETRVMERLTDTGNIVFAKGYMVERYQFVPDGLFLHNDVSRVPPTVHQHKIAWRDVSRDSQVRRMKATILPPEHICGNSLGVICAGANDLHHLKILLAIINSLVFEYQARSLLASNHVSAGIVKQIRVPKPGPYTDIVRLVDRRSAGEAVENELELAVAALYGLSPNAYQMIVESYCLPEDLKAALIQQYFTSYRKKGEGSI